MNCLFEEDYLKLIYHKFTCIFCGLSRLLKVHHFTKGYAHAGGKGRQYEWPRILMMRPWDATKQSKNSTTVNAQ